MASVKRNVEDFSQYFPYEKLQMYRTISPLLNSTYDEIKSLSSKKQDAPLNKLKVTNINRLISSAREILVDSDMLPYLEVIDDECLPTYSDVSIILKQYLKAFEKLKSNNIVYKEGKYYWRTTSGLIESTSI